MAKGAAVKDAIHGLGGVVPALDTSSGAGIGVSPSPQLRFADIILSNVPVEAVTRAAAMQPPILIPSREDIATDPLRGISFLKELVARTTEGSPSIEDREVMKSIYELAAYLIPQTTGSNDSTIAESTQLAKDQALQGIALLGQSIRHFARALPEPPPVITSDLASRQAMANESAATSTLFAGLHAPDPSAVETATAKTAGILAPVAAVGGGI